MMVASDSDVKAKEDQAMIRRRITKREQKKKQNIYRLFSETARNQTSVRPFVSFNTNTNLDQVFMTI